jgi:hypothetical protein
MANVEPLNGFIGELLFCNFVSLGPFLVLNYLEADLVVLGYYDIWHEASCMNKIILSVVACNEAKSLGYVKEFYCSGYHFDSSA